MSRLCEATLGLLERVMGRHEDPGPAGLRLRAWRMRHLPGRITADPIWCGTPVIGPRTGKREAS